MLGFARNDPHKWRLVRNIWMGECYNLYLKHKKIKLNLKRSPSALFTLSGKLHKQIIEFVVTFYKESPRPLIISIR